MLLLGERFSIQGVGGILLVIVDTFIVQMQRISFSELIRPFRDLSSPSVRAALLAGFIYSIGSIAEKNGVRHYSPFYFTYFLVLSMLLLMSLNLARPKYRMLVAEEFRENWRPILCSGPVVMASFLTFRYGLNLAPVGYAVPVRQVMHHDRSNNRDHLSAGIVWKDQAGFSIDNRNRCDPDQVRVDFWPIINGKLKRPLCSSAGLTSVPVDKRH